MTRVEFGTTANTIALVGVGLFGVALLGVGAALIVGADRIHTAQPDMSLAAIYGSGGVASLIGLWLVRVAVRDWRAIAIIEFDHRGAWLLKNRFGQVRGQVPAGVDPELSLTGALTWVINPGMPKQVPVVRGVLWADGRGYRLAEAGPVDYDRALAGLGIDEAAPDIGESFTIALTGSWSADHE